MIRVRAARRRALDVVLPTDAETLLLRALLWPGEDGTEAWRRWFDAVIAPLPARERLPDNVKALLPMLHSALRAKGIAPERAFASYIRAAYVREELRGRAYRRILENLLDAAAVASVRPLILGGRALADAVYRDPDCRHSHGIRLLIRETAAAAFARSLPGLDYRPATTRAPGVFDSWVHGSGLPLEMCTAFLAPPYDRVCVDDLFARGLAVPALHAQASMLCPEDELLRVCVRAATSRSRTSLRWACDAWLLADKHADRLDWRFVTKRAREAGASLVLSVVLGFLARDLHAAVPAVTLAELAADAERADERVYEVAMLGALPGSQARMWDVVRTTPGLRLRLAVLRPLVLPSPSALRAVHPGAMSLPLAYLLRPMRFLRRRLATWIPQRSSVRSRTGTARA